MEDCIFCKIVRGEFNTEFLYSDNDVVAFNDVNPQAPFHIIIIPRDHFVSIKEISNEQLIGRLFTTGNAIAKQLELDSYRFVINTGKEAGQSVFHVHLHLLGGREMNWPPG